MKNEFNIYDKIISGELRPHLEINSSDEGIKRIRNEFLSFPFKFEKITGNQLVLVSPENISDEKKEYIKILLGEGEKYIFNFDTENPDNCSISSLDQQNEEILIDLDIPPPCNSKAEIYLDLIETEYKRIKISAKDFYASSSSLEDLKLYANKNIKLGKESAKNLYTYNKKINKKDCDFLEDENCYICYILKIYLIRILVFFHELFVDIIDYKFTTEYDLKLELFGEVPYYHKEFIADIEKDLVINKLKKGSDDSEHTIKLSILKSLALLNSIYRDGYFNDENIKTINKFKILIQFLENLYLAYYLNIDKTKLLNNYNNLDYYLELSEIIKIKYRDTINGLDSIEDIIVYLKNEIYKIQSFLDFNDKLHKSLTLNNSLLRIYLSILETDINKYTIYFTFNDGELEKYINDAIISVLLNLQNRSTILKLIHDEDKINDLFIDNIQSRLNIFNISISDQKRSGKTKNIKELKSILHGGVGRPDFVIHRNSDYISIIESLLLSTMNKEYIISHINDIFNYDSSGLNSNYLICYYFNDNFDYFYRQYLSFLNEMPELKYSIKNISKNDSLKYSDLKQIVVTHLRENTTVKVNHILLKIGD